MTFRPPLSTISQCFLAALWLGIVSLFAQTPSFVVFDAADAGQGQNQGTVPRLMNQNGVIAGTYIDKSNQIHCFVRLPNGQLTEFDVFASPTPLVTGINSRGQIVGYALIKSSQHANHGFLRNPNGTIGKILVPEAVSTYAMSINDSGEIAGYYTDSTNDRHGFLRDAAGNYTPFDEPNAVGMPNGGTTVSAINANSEIAGSYTDAVGVNHGFTRDAAGNYTSYDAPGSGTNAGEGTLPSALNATEEIIGIYLDQTYSGHSFLRDPSGNFLSLEIDDPSCIPTSASVTAVNDVEAVIGSCTDPTEGDQGFVYHGFLRDVTGHFTIFSVPAASDRTFPTAINNKGRIAGYYRGVRLVDHGFVR
jgi:hypothetical protein